MNVYLINILFIIILCVNPNIELLSIDPTPIPTPTKLIIGILLAKYRKPIKIILINRNWFIFRIN